MDREEIRRMAGKIMEARRLLEEVDQTQFEGVNANLKRAMISIQQAMYDLGEEDEAV